jgi:thiosulfate reductase/polysulfide reductase chain A
MTSSTVYSVCGMCSVRCPIQVEVEDGRVVLIQGNRECAGIQGAVCARGAAGTALMEDGERPQFPMIRAGARGEGKWRRVSWDEALDHVAQELSRVREAHGPGSILLSDRGGPFRELHRAFLRGLGSPNYCNHDSACARNVQHAALSLFGMGRKSFVYDLKNARHVVLQTRNIFEAINVKEANQLLGGMSAGCRLTVIDIRATVTACKADSFLLIRPGTDYALNLAVIRTLLDQGLYDREFAARHIQGLEETADLVRPCTPQWAEAETGIPAASILELARDLSKAAPAVVWHPGWMTARYRDSFYVCRTAYMINALLGSVGAKGGLPLANKPGDVGRKGLKSLMEIYPKPAGKREDGAGWAEGRTHFEGGPGLLHLDFAAMAPDAPRPIRAYIAHRHDPLMAYPDPEALRRTLDNLELLVSVTFSWSDTAWYADVILPLSTYLERDSAIATRNGLKPEFFLRRQAVPPRFDTRAEWEIYGGLARRLGLDKLDFASIEDVWRYQLEGTGVSMEDFQAKGFVPLCEAPVYQDPAALRFKTPSGRIEFVSSALEKDGMPSLKAYEPPAPPPPGRFRLTFGRCAVHTQGHTVNNPLLSAQVPENILWINRGVAQARGLAEGEEVVMENLGGSGRIKAHLTDFIHPEAVFLLHGFGHHLPVESRAKDRGLADQEFMPGGLAAWDQAGGGVCMQEHFVEVRKA